MNLPNVINLELTHELARGSEYISNTDCPIARGLKALGYEQVSVGPYHATIHDVLYNFLDDREPEPDEIESLIDGDIENLSVQLIKGRQCVTGRSFGRQPQGGWLATAKLCS